MRSKKLSAAVGLMAASALALAACSPGGGGEKNEGDQSKAEGQYYTVEPENSGLADLGDVETKDGSIAFSVGEVEFSSYNSNTPETYSTYNSAITDRMFSGFTYFGTDGTLYKDENYGTYEKISDDPLKVKYTINEDAVWSDGTPITNADYILQWAIQNPNVKKQGEEDPMFNSVSTDFGEYVTEMPEGELDGKEFTITYDEPYADWEILIGGAQPAHVVARESGVSLEEMYEAIQEQDWAKLEPMAEFWNTGWEMKPGELLDEEMIPVSGPYKLSSWEAGESITLEANDKYWGPKPATKNLVARFADPSTHVQALKNGDLDVIEPQATVDTVKQIEDLGEGFIMQESPSLIWEHLDFNFMEGSLFADSKELREAFAYCVPRELIVENLIKPIQEDAVVMNAREVFPQMDHYDDVVKESYDGRYDEVDIEKSKELIKESGKTDLKVRLGYSSPNPRRSETVQLIKDSCDEAGFDIVDAGAEDFFNPGGVQERGDYEVSLFAWSGSGQKTSGRNIYHSNGQQNFNEFSSEAVDKAWDRQATELDEDKQKENLVEIEKALWDELHGIPIYAHPNIVGNNADVANVRVTGVQSGVVWNAEQWSLREKE